MKQLQLLAIGERLRLARLEARVTLRDAGKFVDRTRQSVAGWEAGMNEIGIVQLALLAALYRVTTDYVIYGGALVPGSLESSEQAKAEMLEAFRKAASDS